MSRKLIHCLALVVTAAILSDELGFSTLAIAYKNDAEGLLLRQPDLTVFVPGVSDAGTAATKESRRP